MRNKCHTIINKSNIVKDNYKSWFVIYPELEISHKCDPIILISQLQRFSDKAIWYDNEFSKIRYGDKCP